MKEIGRNSSSESEIYELVENFGIVKELREESLDKHELADRLGVSSKTVYRRVGDLMDLRLVKRDGNEYQLTNIGHMHAELFEYIRDVSATIYGASGLLEDVSEDALPPFQTFEDGDIICSEPCAPAKPMKTMESFVSGASRLKGFSPVLLPEYVELHEIVSEELDTELVLTEAVAAHLRSEYEDQLERVVESGATILKTPVEMSFGLLIAKEPVPELLLLVYGPRSRLNGVLRTDNAVGLSWAEATYQNVRSNATPLEG